jgi:hypothetical protein
MPPEHIWPALHVLPQVPQFVLSVWVLAQYGAPPSGVHVVSAPHVRLHCPPVHIFPGSHVLPQVPQFVLSVWVLAQ